MFRKIVLFSIVFVVIASQAEPQSYLDQIGLTLNQDFISRVEMAIVQAAMSIRIEPTGTQFHSQRTYLAGVVLDSPRGKAAQLAVPIVTDPIFVGAITCSGTPQVCSTTVTDAQLYAVVSAQWNSWAVGN